MTGPVLLARARPLTAPGLRLAFSPRPNVLPRPPPWPAPRPPAAPSLRPLAGPLLLRGLFLRRVFSPPLNVLLPPRLSAGLLHEPTLLRGLSLPRFFVPVRVAEPLLLLFSGRLPGR